jgi:D-3-phosphoglycerate dehydrogenase
VIDAADLRPGSCRLVNVHKDVPGVLSRVNHVVAAVGINISGQHLVTGGGVGLLLMDIEVPRDDARATALSDGIAQLDQSVRTRLIG